MNKSIEQKQHGYTRSPALNQAGTAVLFWKSILTSKMHYILSTTKAQELVAKANIVKEAIEFMSEPDVHKEVQGAWNKL